MSDEYRPEAMVTRQTDRDCVTANLPRTRAELCPPTLLSMHLPTNWTQASFFNILEEAACTINHLLDESAWLSR